MKTENQSNEPLKLTFRPVDTTTWDDMERLFEGKGCPSYCWCMAWRATREERQHSTNADRKAQIKQRVMAGVPVGLLGYLDDVPVAWCSIAPRDTYRPLGGPEDDDGENVWSLVCMFTLRTLRRQGLSRQLIAAAVAHARQQGATIVEAYPVAIGSPSYRHMGYIPMYTTAGFHEVGRVGTRWHVMRLRVARGKTE
jgi:GNAT superfamily N-acetyltransferase